MYKCIKSNIKHNNKQIPTKINSHSANMLYMSTPHIQDVSYREYILRVHTAMLSIYVQKYRFGKSVISIKFINKTKMGI